MHYFEDVRSNGVFMLYLLLLLSLLVPRKWISRSMGRGTFYWDGLVTFLSDSGK